MAPSHFGVRHAGHGGGSRSGTPLNSQEQPENHNRGKAQSKKKIHDSAGANTEAHIPQAVAGKVVDKQEGRRFDVGLCRSFHKQSSVNKTYARRRRPEAHTS